MASDRRKNVELVLAGMVLGAGLTIAISAASEFARNNQAEPIIEQTWTCSDADETPFVIPQRNLPDSVLWGGYRDEGSRVELGFLLTSSVRGPNGELDTRPAGPFFTCVPTN